MYSSALAATGNGRKVLTAGLKSGNIQVSRHNGYRAFRDAKKQIIGVVEDTKYAHRL